MMPHEWPKTKSYVAGKDLFLFSVFCIVTKKTGNTGAGKLCGRAHPMADGVYLLYRLLEDDSTKSYGEEKTNRNSTDNTQRVLQFSLITLIVSAVYLVGNISTTSASAVSSKMDAHQAIAGKA